jgi:hypothetical protein
MLTSKAMPRGEEHITTKALNELEEHIAATTNRAFDGVQTQLNAIRKEMATKKELRSAIRASETRIVKAIKAHSYAREVKDLTDKVEILERQMTVVRERLHIAE